MFYSVLFAFILSLSSYACLITIKYKRLKNEFVAAKNRVAEIDRELAEIKFAYEITKEQNILSLNEKKANNKTQLRNSKSKPLNEEFKKEINNLVNEK
jgi:hypothetical protein